MSKSWDNSILKKLKALMGRGLSTSEIGKRLGMSKNAIVGKMHRMGWNPKAADAKPVKETAKKTNVKDKGVKKQIAEKKIVAKKAPVVKAPKAGAKVKKTVVVEKTAKPVKAAKETKPAKNTAKTSVVKKSEPKTPAKSDAKSNVRLVAVGRPIAGHGAGAHQRIVQHALEMANLKPNQCRWPIGDPDSDGFHFCGKAVFVGKPYCFEHCKMAYQFAPPKKK